MTDNSIRLDFSDVDRLPPPPRQQESTLRVRIRTPLSIKSESIKVASESPMAIDGSHQNAIMLSRLPGRTEAQLDFAGRSQSVEANSYQTPLNRR